MKRIYTILSLIGIVLATFTATAFAQGTIASSDGNLLDLARPVFDAVMHGNWWMAAALAVVFLTAATRKYLPDAYGGTFARGDVGGMITAFTVSFAGAVATTLAAPGAVMTGAVALVALKVGLGAIGGFVALHKLATWAVGTTWFQTKTPAWLRAGVGLLLGLIGSSAVAKAEKAGQDAVDAAPPGGAGAVTGGPTEV